MSAVFQNQSAALPRYVQLRPALSVAAALLAGLALRAWLLPQIFLVNGDSLLYGAMAKNLLLHGRYALGSAPQLAPTLIRLPGYPLFLALCFRLFGMENYWSAACVQIALELFACLLLADFARRIVPARFQAGAAHATLWLAALCPFTASYAVLPLAETPTLFCIALALWAAARFRERSSWPPALAFTFAITWAALLRPDGALVAVALAPALLYRLPAGNAIRRAQCTRMVLICVLLALTPFAAWTVRNWRVFHVVQPLAPRLAVDPGEDPHLGWELWIKTWCLDWISTYQIYWNVPGASFDSTQLPNRAFDSPAQRAETFALAESYQAHGMALTPPIDAAFARLARQRIAAHPLRFYLWLPLGRLADMLLRPRVENLAIDADWWVYSNHHFDTVFSWCYAALNLLYLLLAVAGLWLRPRFARAMVAYILLRCALLLTIQAPETRYTLEFFPILFVLGGLALYRCTNVVCLSVLKLKASLGSS